MMQGWLHDILASKLGVLCGLIGAAGAMGGPVLALSLGALTLLDEEEDTDYQFLLVPALATLILLSNQFLMPKFNKPNLQTKGTLELETVL